MENIDLDLFKEICECNAISGGEASLVRLLKSYYVRYSDEIIYDNLGCMVSYKKSNKKGAKKVLVLAHADEIGFVVSDINNDGTVKVNPVGGINVKTLFSNRVLLKNKNGDLLNGVINVSNAENVKDIEIDIGCDSREEVLNKGVSVSNEVYFVGNFERLSDNRVVSKAIDDRYGCFLTVELLKELENVELDVDLYVGVSVQEEVGCRGAQTIANLVNPDFAIILDCSPSDPKNNNGILGKGVLLRVKDANMLSFKPLINYQKSVCKEVGVPCQYFISQGGTDAGSVHKSNDGVLTLTHCVCAKNLHSSSTIMDLNDYVSAKKSLVYIIKDLNEDRIIKFKEEMH